MTFSFFFFLIIIAKLCIVCLQSSGSPSSFSGILIYSDILLPIPQIVSASQEFEKPIISILTVLRPVRKSTALVWFTFQRFVSVFDHSDGTQTAVPDHLGICEKCNISGPVPELQTPRPQNREEAEQSVVSQALQVNLTFAQRANHWTMEVLYWDHLLMS